jgi:GNAT superfamily N-acetyltransferase
MSPLVRRATAEDADTLLDLRLRFVAEVRDTPVDTFGPGFLEGNRRFLTDRVADGSYVAWLAVDGEGAVGTVGVSLVPVPPRDADLSPFDGLILSVYVDPAWRRRGIAQELMGACLAARGELGIRRLFLHTTDEGRPLYESLGFEQRPEWLFLIR